MAHLDRMETRWVQRIEALMPLSGVGWIMLTHAESCHPETEVDAERLARIAAGTATEADRRVNFIRYGREHGQPDFNHWAGHGCKVVFFAERDETSVDQAREAKHWALKADAGALVRASQRCHGAEDDSYEKYQTQAARAEMKRRFQPIRTGPGVLTSSVMRQIHDEAWLFGGQMGPETSRDEKHRFIAGTHHIIKALIRDRVFVTHDDETSGDEHEECGS